jgi:hypothetical protein
MDDKTLTRLLAVEVLLSDPEALANDALESDLYILRDRLRTEYRSRPTPRSNRPAAAAPGRPGRNPC